MKTEAIDKILFDNDLTKSVFRGCYPCDEIPVYASPYAVIVNTDNSSLPGSHWILLYVTEKVYFFDSFGRNYDSLMFNRDFVENITKIIGDKKSEFSPKMVQSLLGDTCGQFCMFYLFEKCLGVQNILKPFTNNLKYNDNYVTRFVNSM